jgi:hypothetical protein
MRTFFVTLTQSVEAPDTSDESKLLKALKNLRYCLWEVGRYGCCLGPCDGRENTGFFYMRSLPFIIRMGASSMAAH